jgi:GDP-mannose 6-dehydrogenase
MKVSVFGLGYVGCVTASCLARNGHQVVGVDVSVDKVAMINRGESPIVEPGLGDLISAMVTEGRLSATQSGAAAIQQSDIALICVGTPDTRNGSQDLGALSRVAADIGRACASRVDPITVVLRSTVLPGTTERVLTEILAETAGAGAAAIRLAVNPEFMREGSSLEDFAHPPFILVGCDDPDVAEALREMYAGVDAPFLQTNVRTAEMTKYVCNAFHALKICFANEIADLCEPLGADAQDVMRVVCEDRKLNISPAYMKPGFAFGGSCLPKDVRALLATGRANDVPVPVIGAIISSNAGQTKRGIEAVLQTGRRKVGVVGLAFKPTTDDLRESPMVAVVEALIGKGCDVRVYDPNVVLARLHGANRQYIETGIPHISALLCDDIDALIAHSEVLVFGSPGAEAARVLAASTDSQVIVDLTHGALGAAARRRPAREVVSTFTPAALLHALQG